MDPGTHLSGSTVHPQTCIVMSATRTPVPLFLEGVGRQRFPLAAAYLDHRAKAGGRAGLYALGEKDGTVGRHSTPTSGTRSAQGQGGLEGDGAPAVAQGPSATARAWNGHPGFRSREKALDGVEA